ncbi:MAG: phosphodiester glycosidase family protein [Gemmatimonadetes bacterium]|nr:phosphodiester glycosidase family protein [Gemmatimonadota bacterium]
MIGTDMRRLLCLLLAATAPARAQRADSLTTRTLAPGVTWRRIVRLDGPWIVNVVTVDLRRGDLTLREVRAHDALRSRERPSDMVKRRQAEGVDVIAAVNADFFNIKTGENENNQVIDGEWWKGVKVTESPYDTFDNAHAQFGLDSAGHPLLDRFLFEGEARAGKSTFPLITLNAVPTGPEGAALYTARFGATAPREIPRPAPDNGYDPDNGPVQRPPSPARAVAEAPLVRVGERGGALLFERRGAVRTTSGGEIPPGGAVLAGYGATAKSVAAVGEGETLAVSLRAVPAAPRAPLALLVGGWPRILRDGRNIAAHSASEEGTIAGNALGRHPRTAIGFSRDSATLYLVVVDGRSPRSVGISTVDLADLMLDLGAWQALNFDGGGSTTMVVRDSVVNAPTDPTGERAVGNALLLVRTSARTSGRPH